MSFFFFNDTATTEIYTLSLHDALPIYPHSAVVTNGTSNSVSASARQRAALCARRTANTSSSNRSEEHTSELQSQSNLVCRLLLEKKKTDGSPNRLPLT